MIGLATLLASATQANQEQLDQSIKAAHVESARTATQLKTTLEALNALTKQTKGDLRPAYSNYCTQVSETVKSAEWTKTQILWMAGDGRKHFLDWQVTVTAIANSSLRKKSQKRLDDVKKSFEKVDASLVQASEKFKPFLSNLADIKASLSADMTAKGLKAIKSTVSSANSNYKSVERAIESVLKELENMVKELSPDAK